VVNEAVNLCRREFEKRSVTVLLDLGEEPLEVPMDRPRMVEVFRNLVENALQHTPSGNRVTIEATVLPWRAGRVEIRVLDAGPGFSETDRDKVFQPFFSRRPGGTGLGLSIVQRIVTAHGGEVMVTTRPQGGGMVSVQLPL
jgi:signal transduction histidine kinase